jgi:hypothetical protein
MSNTYTQEQQLLVYVSHLVLKYFEIAGAIVDGAILIAQRGGFGGRHDPLLTTVK